MPPTEHSVVRRYTTCVVLPLAPRNTSGTPAPAHRHCRSFLQILSQLRCGPIDRGEENETTSPPPEKRPDLSSQIQGSLEAEHLLRTAALRLASAVFLECPTPTTGPPLWDGIENHGCCYLQK